MNRPLRFLTFNIHGGRSRDGKHDLGRVHALMERFDIDIGVFQEMETRPSRGAKPDDVEKLAGSTRPYRIFGASVIEEGGWFGNLIVSRYPILRGLVHNLETKPELEPRNALDVLIAAPQGNLRLIGTHLSLSVFERWSEAHNLLHLMHSVEKEERYPLFLMGDINEWQYPSRLIRFLGSIMKPLPCRATFPSFLPLFKLDRAWFDAPRLNVTAHRLDSRDVRLLSDHLPLLVEVNYP